jgi:hypothetical protein
MSNQAEGLEEQMVNHRQWEPDFYEALEKIENDPHSNLQDLIELVFQKGILDRLCPRDEKIKQIHLERGHQIWAGSRNDAELYYRIFYCASACIYSIQQNWSLSFGGYVSTVSQAFYQAMSHADKYPELKGHRSAPIFILEKIQQRCLIELESLGHKCPKKFFAVGEEGSYYGYLVKIDIIDFLDGDLCFITTDPDRRKAQGDYMDICRANGGCWASPFEMHQGAFIPDA